MSQNDYIILRDEDGKAYIAHAGLLDNARNAIRGAANSISTTAQQVANKAKGVGRGVRQNHKYILKVNENGRTRYFYKQEEVKAYYEAKKRGIKNPAEYAQKAADAASNAVDAVKNVASKAGNAAKSAFREATGQAARDRMDTAAARRDTEAVNMHNANTRRQKAENDKAIAEQKRAEALSDIKNARTAQRGLQEKMDKDADRISAVDRKKNNDEYNRRVDSWNLSKRALDTQRQKEMDGYRRENSSADKIKAAKKEIDSATSEHTAARDAYQEADSNYNKNKAAYDKSLAGAVDRTAARARETASSTFSKAKDAANNTVSNAKSAYERMKGEFRDRAEQAGNAVKSTAKNAVDKAKDIAGYDEKERFDKAAENKQNTKDAARKGEQYVTDVLNESNPLHRTQTEAQRLNAAVGIRNERWNAEDKARAEYLRARDAYNKTPLAMINRAKEAISSATDSVRDATKDTAEAVARVPKAVKNAVKNAAEDVAFNAQYYSKQLKEGITGEKATKMASDIREEARIWKNRADDTKDKDLRNFYEQQYQKAEDFAKRFDAQAAKSLNGRANSAVNSVKGMIDNARSSTAKTVNEAWDRIPKNSDGTVNPFDKNFQSTYNDWKTKKDKYDSSLAGRAKDAAEKATDSVKDMIDQARKAVKGNSGSANARATKSTYSEYSDNDKDFAEKNYSKKNHVEDTDFYTFKRDDGKWVILEEDMKWVLPEGVTGNDPGVRNALKQFADHASSAKAIGNANYNADQWVDAVTDAIDKAAENQRKR